MAPEFFQIKIISEVDELIDSPSNTGESSTAKKSLQC